MTPLLKKCLCYHEEINIIIQSDFGRGSDLLDLSMYLALPEKLKKLFVFCMACKCKYQDFVPLIHVLVVESNASILSHVSEKILRETGEVGVRNNATQLLMVSISAASKKRQYWVWLDYLISIFHYKIV